MYCMMGGVSIKSLGWVWSEGVSVKGQDYFEEC